MYNRKDQLQQLLSPLCFYLRLSGLAYKKYLANKIFIHAETIRISNRKIYDLVGEKAFLIPGEMKEDILQLMNHYDYWFTQFKTHKKKIKPSLKDEFVFHAVDDLSPYPRQAEQNIIYYTASLEKELTALAQTTEHAI